MEFAFQYKLLISNVGGMSLKCLFETQALTKFWNDVLRIINFRNFTFGNSSTTRYDTRMNDTNDGSIISYQRIPASRSYEVSQVLLNSFFKEEPLGLMLGLTTDQVSRWIPKYIESAIEQNVSVMAVATAPSPSEDDEHSHQETIVGVCVNISESLDILNFIDKNLEPNMWHVGQFLHLLEESMFASILASAFCKKKFYPARLWIQAFWAILERISKPFSVCF